MKKIYLLIIALISIMICSCDPAYNETRSLQTGKFVVTCDFSKMRLDEDLSDRLYGEIRILNTGTTDTFQVGQLYLTINGEHSAFCSRNGSFPPFFCPQIFRKNQVKIFDAYWGVHGFKFSQPSDIKTISIHYSPTVFYGTVLRSNDVQ
ncbi:MAG: hypothetical protein KAH48_12445 [Chlorobi bacterium]|nr:hypothetical protein [Chlorobiota bacterium]